MSNDRDGSHAVTADLPQQHATRNVVVLRDPYMGRNRQDRRLWPLSSPSQAFAYNDNPEAHYCTCGAGNIAYVVLGAGFLCDPCAVATRKTWRNRELRFRRSIPRTGAGCDCGVRECAACENQFQPTRTDGIYCSPKCRQKAYRTRAASRPA